MKKKLNFVLIQNEYVGKHFKSVNSFLLKLRDIFSNLFYLYLNNIRGQTEILNVLFYHLQFVVTDFQYFF